MNNVTPIPVRLEAFEGPLDLLLHLIDKNKINIYDIPVSEITDQYLDYVQQMKEEKLEVASEFLVMAATLLDIKSRMLLPREEKEDEEEEGDPREELVQRLLDYKLTKYQSEELKDKSLEASRNVFRGQDLPREVRDYQPPIDYDELLGDTTLKNLTKIFEDVLKRQKNRVDPVRSTFGRIRKEEVSIEERTEELQEFFRSHSRTSFRALLEGQKTRQTLIVTFLILLDFIKSGIIHVRQSQIFGEIEIFAGALPAGGMGPQETMPGTRAEARALRKARKQKEKQAAAKAEKAANDQEAEAQIPQTEQLSLTEGRTVPEAVSSLQPRVVLSQPGQGVRQDQLKDAEEYIVTRVSGKKREEETDSSLNIEESPSEKAEDRIEIPEEESPDAGPAAPAEAEEAENEEAVPAKEGEVLPETECPEEEESEEEYEDDPEEEPAEYDPEESMESEESDVYRLIRSKDWERVLDEYMEDEGLAELLEEEKAEDADAKELPDASLEEAEGPMQDRTGDTEDSPLTDSEEAGEEEEDFPVSEADEEMAGPRLREDASAAEPSGEEASVSPEEEVSEVISAAEEICDPARDMRPEAAEEEPPEREEILDRETFEEQDTAVKTSACEEESAGPVSQAPGAPEETAGEEEEAGREKEEIQEAALPAERPESRAEDLPEGPVEEEWKKVRYLQPSRLYFSPWAGRWKSPRSLRPSKSRSRMPGRQWKRSERSLAMRAAAFRSIAMTAPCSSPPEQNTTNT